MKKLLVLGTILMGFGMGSCKTYCPAYSYVKPDNEVKQEVPASNTASIASEKSNS